VTTTAVFRGDDFIGQDPRVATWGVRFYRDADRITRVEQPFDCYTVVTVSTEAEPQRYTDVAVHKYWVSHDVNAGWSPRARQLSLSQAQAGFLRQWLMERSSDAWRNSDPGVKGLLGDR
jgi:hypothetical protein